MCRRLHLPAGVKFSQSTMIAKKKEIKSWYLKVMKMMFIDTNDILIIRLI